MLVDLELVETKNVASMKALPKRKGNLIFGACIPLILFASMKALPKRKGNASGDPDVQAFASPQ